MTKGARQADGTLHGNSEEGALARQGRDRERGHGQVGRKSGRGAGRGLGLSKHAGASEQSVATKRPDLNDVLKAGRKADWRAGKSRSGSLKLFKCTLKDCKAFEGIFLKITGAYCL